MLILLFEKQPHRETKDDSPNAAPRRVFLAALHTYDQRQRTLLPEKMAWASARSSIVVESKSSLSGGPLVEADHSVEVGGQKSDTVLVISSEESESSSGKNLETKISLAKQISPSRNKEDAIEEEEAQLEDEARAETPTERSSVLTAACISSEKKSLREDVQEDVKSIENSSTGKKKKFTISPPTTQTNSQVLRPGPNYNTGLNYNVAPAAAAVPNINSMKLLAPPPLEETSGANFFTSSFASTSPRFVPMRASVLSGGTVVGNTPRGESRRARSARRAAERAAALEKAEAEALEEAARRGCVSARKSSAKDFSASSKSKLRLSKGTKFIPSGENISTTLAINALATNIDTNFVKKSSTTTSTSAKTSSKKSGRLLEVPPPPHPKTLSASPPPSVRSGGKPRGKLRFQTERVGGKVLESSSVTKFEPLGSSKTKTVSASSSVCKSARPLVPGPPAHGEFTSFLGNKSAPKKNSLAHRAASPAAFGTKMSALPPPSGDATTKRSSGTQKEVGDSTSSKKVVETSSRKSTTIINSARLSFLAAPRVVTQKFSRGGESEAEESRRSLSRKKPETSNNTTSNNFAASMLSSARRQLGPVPSTARPVVGSGYNSGAKPLSAGEESTSSASRDVGTTTLRETQEPSSKFAVVDSTTSSSSSTDGTTAEAATSSQTRKPTVVVVPRLSVPAGPKNLSGRSSARASRTSDPLNSARLSVQSQGEAGHNALPGQKASVLAGSTGGKQRESVAAVSGPVAAVSGPVAADGDSETSSERGNNHISDGVAAGTTGSASSKQPSSRGRETAAVYASAADLIFGDNYTLQSREEESSGKLDHLPENLLSPTEKKLEKFSRKKNTIENTTASVQTLLGQEEVASIQTLSPPPRLRESPVLSARASPALSTRSPALSTRSAARSTRSARRSSARESSSTHHVLSAAQMSRREPTSASDAGVNKTSVVLRGSVGDFSNSASSQQQQQQRVSSCQQPLGNRITAEIHPSKFSAATPRLTPPPKTTSIKSSTSKGSPSTSLLSPPLLSSPHLRSGRRRTTVVAPESGGLRKEASRMTSPFHSSKQGGGASSEKVSSSSSKMKASVTQRDSEHSSARRKPRLNPPKNNLALVAFEEEEGGKLENNSAPYRASLGSRKKMSFAGSVIRRKEGTSTVEKVLENYPKEEERASFGSQCSTRRMKNPSPVSQGLQASYETRANRRLAFF